MSMFPIGSAHLASLALLLSNTSMFLAFTTVRRLGA